MSEIFYHNSFWQQTNFSPIRFLLPPTPPPPPHMKDFTNFCFSLLWKWRVVVFFLHPCIPIAGLEASEEKKSWISQGGILFRAVHASRVISGLTLRVCFFNKSERSLSLEIICIHFILSGPYTSLHICNHIHFKKMRYNLPKMRSFGTFPKIHPSLI